MHARRKSASVLEKAQGLLKQSRRLSSVPATTAKSTEGSELDAYLSQLSMKTSGTPSKKTVVIEGLSDLSLTTDDEGDNNLNPEQGMLQSRFVKKSLSQTFSKPASSVEGLAAVSAKRRPVSASGKLNKTAPSYSSSALEKAAAFTAKYASKKQSATQIVMSDDSDLNEEIIAQITSEKSNVKSNLSTKRRPVSASGKLNKKAPSYTSTALEKAAAFTGKYASKKESAAQIVMSDDSDLTEEIISHITSEKLNVKSSSSTKLKGAKNRTNNTDKNSRSVFNSAIGSSQQEKNLGFLKNKQNKNVIEIKSHSLKESSDHPYNSSSDEHGEQIDSHQSNFKSSQAGKFVDTTNHSKYLKKTSIMDQVQTSTPKKKENIAPLNSFKTFGDSDDEMQAFIMNLSPVTSPDIPPIRTQQTPVRAARTKVKENVEKRIESQFIENITSTNDSIPEENNNSLEGFHSNVLQITDLQAVISDVGSTKKETAKQKAPNKNQKVLTSRSSVSSIHTIDEDNDDIAEEIKTERSISSIRKFGLQTIDDLLDKDTSPRKSESYTSYFESVSEILTEKTISEIKTENSVSTQIQEAVVEDSYSQSFEESSNIKNKKKKRSVPDSFSTFISTQTSQSYDSRNTSPQLKRRVAEQGSFIYTEDFDSDSRQTDSEVEDLPRDASRTETLSQSYSETRTLTVTPRKAKRRSTAPGIDIGTQVNEGGLQYQWNPDAGVAVLGPSVLGYTDPTPVASHIISPHDLEALTGYSPSVLAMNDMLRAQLIVTQTGIQHMHRLHHQLVNSISEDYQYTTLEETRQYIKKHRQSRLTMADALKQVKEEMEEGYR